MELNYAGIINAGQGIVGNLQEQLYLADQRKQQQQAQALKLSQAKQQQERQQAFAQRLAQVTQSGRYTDIPNLMMEFPEFAEQIKPAYDTLSKEGRARNLTQMGTITKRATNGDLQGAIGLLRQRVEADKAAGQDTSEEEDAIKMLSSDDPMQRQSAISTLHILTYNADPDGYKTLFPTDATTTVQKEYQWRVQQFGQQKADKWLAVQDTKLVPVQAGGSVFNAADLIPQIAEGGDQSTGMGGVPAPALGPNGLPTTLTPDQYRVTVEALGKAKTDAWMKESGITVENVARQGTAQTPVKVRSVQEARRLPSGTVFVAPDGRTMRKP